MTARDWSAHPLGLVPDTLIAEVLGCSPGPVYCHRKATGTPAANVGQARFPCKPWAWRPLLEAWGPERARAWLVAYCPSLVETFDRDLPEVASSQRGDDIREALGWARRRGKRTRERSVARKDVPARTAPPKSAPRPIPKPAPRRIPEEDPRRIVIAIATVDSKAERQAHREQLREAWDRYVARGGTVTIAAPAGSGSATGTVVGITAAPERFEEVSRVQ